MSWTIARADNNLYPTPPNPAVFPRSSVATVPFSTLATNFPKAVWCDFTSDSLGGGSQLVPAIEATGATVRAIHDSAVGIKAIGGVVQHHDDARASTPDGAVFVPGVAGEGLLGGNLTALNGATALTVRFEFVKQPGSTDVSAIFSRGTAQNATGNQFTIQDNGTSTILCQIGNGVAINSRVDASGSWTSGVRYRFYVRYDGAAGTDATRVTFWRQVYDPLTDTWGALAQFASTVSVAGVPAALISIPTANMSVGRFPYAGNNYFGIIGGNGESIRVWDSALTEAQMIADAAAATPAIPTLLSYNFSGSTPLTNLGTAGSVGDLTAGANTPIVSGDRRYFGRASAGTSRPQYITSGVYPACVFDGTNDYFRNVARGQLENITADAMVVHIGTAPATGGGASRAVNELSVSTTRGLLGGYILGDDSYQTRVAGVTGAAIATPSGVRVLQHSRLSNLATTTYVRDGLNAEASLAGTPASSAAITRCTDGATAADTPTTFCAMTQYVRIVITGVTSSTVRQQIAEICSAYAARYCGATVT